MNKHSVALILTYFVQMPNYFPLWLKSVEANPNFTFMIFSDVDLSSYNIPANVKAFHLKFEEFRSKIKSHLDFDFIFTPYKSAEYRPLYGLIFQEYLEGYDFWGQCEADMIFGKIDNFITDEILSKYDKIQHYGHFVLYRNNEASRTFALHELPGYNISYRDIFRASNWTGYDESALLERLFSKYNYGGGGNIYPSVCRYFTIKLGV